MNQRREYLKKRFNALLRLLQTEAEFKNHLESEFQSLHSDHRFSRRDLIKICASVAGLVAANTFVAPQSALGFIRARIMRRKVANLPPGLYSWGTNLYGQLGQGNFSTYLSPQLVGTTTTTWSSVEVPHNSTAFMARKTDGTLWVAGQDTGSLGSGLSCFADTPTQIVDGTFTKFYAQNGSSFENAYIALRNDNTVWIWGNCDYENPKYGDSSSPVQLSGSWVDIFPGNRSMGALKSDNTLWVWGRNGSGGLGTGNTTSISSPVQILSAASWVGLVLNGDSVAASYALKSDGSLYGWGMFEDASWPNEHQASPVQVGIGQTWSQVVSTWDGTVALTTTGKLYATGSNQSCQLGLGDSVHRSSFEQIGSATNWASLSSFCSSRMIFALKTDSTLWAWGNPNGSYSTGLGINSTVSTPVQVGSDSTWIKISGGGSHGLGIQSDGSLWAWGANSNGQLGLGDYTTRSIPTRVGTLTTWTQVFAGGVTSFAIKSDGTLWTMGSNSSGQLGNTSTNSPIQLGTATNWKSVSIGDSMTFLQDTAGNVYFTGTNSYQLTSSASVNGALYTSPALVGTQNWTMMAGSGKNSLDSTIFATKSDGTLWVWGRNDVNLSGRQDGASYSTPVQVGTETVWTKIFSNFGSHFGIKSNGSLWTWGKNNSGALGLGTTSTKLTPFLVSPAGTWKFICQLIGAPSTYAGIKTDGTLWAWGFGESSFGYIPVTPYKDRISPVQIGTDTTWTKIFSSGQSPGVIFAQKASGAVWVWGYNTDGRAGLGHTTNIPSPVQFGTATDWTHISPQSAGFFVKSNGNLFFAGENRAFIPNVTNGTYLSSMVQIGSGISWASVYGTWASSFYATSMVGLDSTGKILLLGRNRTAAVVRSFSTPVQFTSSTQWSKIAMGTTVGLGIKTDGTMWSWGSNGNNFEGTFIGALGIGGYASSRSPRQIGSLLWSEVATSVRSQVAIRSDGTLWGWGQVLGSSSTFRSSPVQIGAATNWANISVGGNTNSIAAALQLDGTIWTWGYGNNGASGQGTTTSSSTPVKLGTSTWTKISCGEAHVLAVRSDGTLWAWGRNSAYQLARSGSDMSSPVQIGSATDWLDVSANADSSAALKVNGTIWTWGNSVSNPTQAGAATLWQNLSGGTSRFVIR